MSNWLSEFSGEDQQQVDTLNATGIAHKPTQQKTPGLWDGAALAVPKGMVAGTIKVIDTAAKPFERIKDHVQYAYDDIEKNGIDGGINVADPSFSEVHDAKNKVRKQELVSEIEQLQDAQNTGTIGNIGFSVSDYLTRAVLGSVAGGIGGAVAATGASETNFVYDNLTTKGVDESTALKVALTDGAIAGGATALPITYGFKGAGGLLADAGLSIGGATGIMTAGQYTSGNILENAGYDQQAKYYEITKEGIATNIILNGLFFGGARGLKHYQQKGLNENVDAEIQSLDADTAVARQDLAEHTLVANELDLDNISTPVHTTDPIQHNNNLVNLDTARSQIESGQPVNVPHDVKGTPKPTVMNYDTMAIPENAKLIARKAKQENIDPVVALTIAQIESSFDPKAKNKKSSAHGLYQVLDEFWNKNGGGNRSDINEQIRMGFKHMRNAERHIKQAIKRDLEPYEHYLGHLLGPGGAVHILRADPNAKLIDIVRKYDKKNANAIVNNNGMTGMTVAQAKAKWQRKWNTLSTRYGDANRTTATGMDGSSYDFAYEVKPLGELIASNDTAFGVNPRYPTELQPRDRTREASRQQVESMANDLKPEWLGESYKLSDGAPIIGFDNVVESGNGRTLAINRAYETGKAEAYTKFVSDFAAARGLDISGIENPVLVRTRLTDTNRADFAKLANESDVAQFSATERAKTDADRLPDSSLLKINNDGSINLESSMDFVRGFVDQLPQSERATSITPEGRLSQEGKRRIESALVQRTYGDSNLVTRLAENLDEDGKNILNSLLRAAPQLAQLADLVKQGGRHQNTIASDLAQATQKYSDIKASGSNIRDYLDQGQLIDDGLSAGARDFLNVFDSNKRSAKAIGDNIQSKINEVEAKGDPRQGSLFGESPEEKAALEIIANNPNQEITVSRTKPDGEVEEITMTLRERLEELDAEAKAAEQDVLAAQTALTCALQFGV